MNRKPRTFGRLFLKWLLTSIGAWLVVLGLISWALRRMLEDDARAGASTDADSIGLPLATFGLLLALVLLAVSAGGAALGAHRARSAADALPPAS